MQKVLFITPDTFGYYKSISRALSRKGLAPLWMNQLPATGVASRVFFRLMPSIARQMATAYFKRELDKIERVDHILIIKGEGVSAAAIHHMRARFPNAKIVFYLWDSISNVSGAHEKIDLCDAAFSFDPEDCARTEHLSHLPLFHSQAHTTGSPTPGFAAFIGTVHSNRYHLIKSLGEEIERVTGVSPYLYFYYPSRRLFALLQLIKRSLRDVRATDVHFVPVPRDQYTEIMRDAEVVIDICHPRQSGLTIRTIEALGAGKKLITNNKNVLRYDFFRPENCYVVDGEPGDEFAKFLNSPFQRPPTKLIEKYHIDTWLSTLLGSSKSVEIALKAR